ncbi:MULTISPECIES: hypothetical protein [unclassified Streptomyces]|uniref:hypothetical protein n=1 Tax=unclassified Streptomyces TaxID=2593676 RepID=UPI001F5224A2|nr:hypothetical protein [Streptomyces sp. CB01249]
MGELITPRRMRPSVALAMAAATGVLGLAGCSSDEKPASAGPSASPTRHTTPSPTGDRAEHVKGETVSRAPKPVNDGDVLLSVASREGNAELPLTKKIGAGSVAIQVNCRGKGTVDVALKPVGLSFPLECVDGEVSSTYNEIQLKRARSEGSVQITAPSTVSWSLTVEQ